MLLHDAIITAAFEAWRTGEPQRANGYQILVMPDVVLTQMAVLAAGEGSVLKPDVIPTIWVEDGPRRAKVLWVPGLGSDPQA